VARPGDDADDGVGDVLGRQQADAGEATLRLLADPRPDMAGQLGGRGAGLDHRHAHVAAGDLALSWFAPRTFTRRVLT
jgi:hypothetical protein